MTSINNEADYAEAEQSLANMKRRIASLRETIAEKEAEIRKARAKETNKLTTSQEERIHARIRELSADKQPMEADVESVLDTDLRFLLSDMRDYNSRLMEQNLRAAAAQINATLDGLATVTPATVQTALRDATVGYLKDKSNIPAMAKTVLDAIRERLPEAPRNRRPPVEQ